MKVTLRDSGTKFVNLLFPQNSNPSYRLIPCLSIFEFGFEFAEIFATAKSPRVSLSWSGFFVSRRCAHVAIVATIWLHFKVINWSPVTWPLDNVSKNTILSPRSKIFRGFFFGALLKYNFLHFKYFTVHLIMFYNLATPKKWLCTSSVVLVLKMNWIRFFLQKAETHSFPASLFYINQSKINSVVELQSWTKM